MAAPAAPGPDDAAAIFDQPTLLTIRLEVPELGVESLRKDPRRYVEARVTAEGKEFPGALVHLKGGQGSFRPLDEKPAFTIKFGNAKSGQRFHGLRKIHLNNSVQDSSYLCEDLAGELFRRSGVPAPRTAWATVSLNGRLLGLYVLREGFTEEFLKLYFDDARGNLYDGGLHSDVIHPLELDSGAGVKDRSDLAALTEAAEVLPAAARWTALEKALDLPRFISFMAMEILSGHSDGYCLMQNNYRIYFEPRTGRAVFLPHGMDRMFWEARAPLQPPMRGLIASAVMETPKGIDRYRLRMAELVERVFQPEWMTNRALLVARLIEPVNDVAARDARLTGARAAARAIHARELLLEKDSGDPHQQQGYEKGNDPCKKAEGEENIHCAQ